MDEEWEKVIRDIVEVQKLDIENLATLTTTVEGIITVIKLQHELLKSLTKTKPKKRGWF